MSELLDFLHHIIDWLVATIGAWGYTGIFLLMFLESSFFPFPSEVVIVPAGYLAFQGQMNIVLVVVWGIVGSIAGALFNYWLALKLGRPFIEKYLRISTDKLDRMDAFFAKHGEVSTFTGRLIPLFRQYISFPAGLAKMNLTRFCVYTGAGAGIWVIILAAIGYFLGAQEDLIAQYLKQATIGALIFVLVVIIGYVFWQRRK